MSWKSYTTNATCRAAELPYFSLSWMLTLMSHDLTSLSVITRLFDFLLAHNPAMISYVGAAVSRTGINFD